MASGPLAFLGQPDQPLLRRSVLDDVTGNPLITSAPTGEVRQRASLLPLGVTDSGSMTLAVPQMAFDAIDAMRAPQRAYSGDLSIWDPATGHTTGEARGAAAGLAGLAMTGSMPFKAPAGAIRSFGGAAAHEDPLAALSAALDKGTPSNAPPASLGSGSLDDLLASMQSAFAGAKPAPSEAAVPFRVDAGAKSWDLYHGSTGGADFQRFDPNFGKSPGHSEAGTLFFSPDPDAASFYAGGSGAGKEAGPRVFRTTVDPGKTKVFDLGDMIENDPTLGDRARAAVLAERDKPTSPAGIARLDAMRNAYRDDLIASRARDREVNAQLADMGLPPAPLSGGSYGHGYQGALIQMAREQGLDTAVLRGLAEHGGADQIVALTPGRVRSYYDPSQLLYSGGPAGMIGLPFLGRDR